jgi:hypothetical protein
MLALLTLLSPIFGILGSLLPSIVGIFQKREDYKYEILLLEAQSKFAVQQAQINMDIENIKADSVEEQSIYAHDSSISGGKFMDALRASIRPVVTYLFFFLFVSVKVAAASVMLHNGLSVPDMLAAVWDTQTMSLFSTILAFWFGARVLEKMDSMSKNRPILNRTVNVVASKK